MTRSKTYSINGVAEETNMTNLVIVESGAKGKKIQAYLGPDYIVESCRGHVQDLPGRGFPDRKQANKAMWASRDDALPEPPWAWTDHSGKSAQSTIKAMITKAKKRNVETIYIATDPDREGEFIAWRLAEIFSEYKTKRVTFNEVTKRAILEAIKTPREVDMNLVDAAKVRRYMDRLVGYRASKFSRSWNLTSMGRVQTPTLGILVDRELERMAFTPQPFYAVTVDSKNFQFKVRFHEKDDPEAWFDTSTEKPRHHPDRTNDEELASSALKEINDIGKLVITESKAGKRRSKPQLPFSTPTLLRTAGSHPKIGWGSKRIMQVANELYQQGLITYLRTDSTRTSPEARSAMANYIENEIGKDKLRAEKDRIQPKESSNTQDAHEAIRPTDPSNREPEGLEKPQLNLYRLIWSRFAASMMIDSEYSTISIRGVVGDFDKPLTSSTSWRTVEGWEWAYGTLRDTPRLSPPEDDVRLGSEIILTSNENSPRMIIDETKPPSRYRQHTLVESMQKEGIGRPSTYATTVEKLLDEKRKYVISENGSLVPSERGIMLWQDIAPMYGNDGKRGVFESDFTARMEDSLDGIEHGGLEAPDVWTNFVNEFSESHDAALEKRRSKPTPKQLTFLKQLLRSLPEEDRMQTLDGRDVEEIDGTDAKRIIDELTERNVVAGPSDKQMALIYKLCDQIELSYEDAAKLADVDSFDDLTGGRSGSASSLISKLIEIQNEKPRPPTERQLSYLRSLLDKSKTDEAVFCKSRSIEKLTDMDANTVSQSIQEFRQLLGIKGRGRKRK